MKGIPIMRLKPARLGRMALLVGATAAVAGASLLGGTVAKAAPANLGTGAGLTFTPTSGSTSMLGAAVTYNAPACPASAQGSAILRAVNSDGTTYSVSAANNSVAAAFSGTLLSNISLLAIQQNGDIGAGGQQEIVVQCYSGVSATGTLVNTVDDFITWSADGSSWTSGGQSSGAAATTTTLAVSPSPASTGQTVTLTATVTATSGTPAGTVSFTAGGSAIGSPVALNASGVATTTTSFTSPGTVQLAAAFTPTSSTAFQSSTSATVPESVTGPLSEPLSVTIAPSGTFTVSVAAGTVALTPSGSTATGTAEPVTVTDSRNTFPGWSVSGQASDFTETATTPAGDISGNQLGWVPTDTALPDGGVLGPTVTPGSPGLGTTAAVWASAAAGKGFGTSTLGANLTLNIPSGSPAGAYSSALSVSYTTSAP